MDHTDHVELLRGGMPGPGGLWADLGSGEGAFTLALADLLAGQGHIYSVDRDAAALRTQARRMERRFPAQRIDYLAADFRSPLDLPALDGVVMANSLHFVPDHEAVLRLVRGYLRPGGRLILVEYNADRGNPWVPHPLSFDTWRDVAARAGFIDVRLLMVRPSRFLNEIYAGLAFALPQG